jgi:hypothetical protein
MEETRSRYAPPQGRSWDLRKSEKKFSGLITDIDREWEEEKPIRVMFKDEAHKIAKIDDTLPLSMLRYCDKSLEDDSHL